MAPASADLVSHKEIPSSIKPRLTAAHASRLRTLWSRGRPSCVGVMSGLDLDLIIHCYLQTVDSGMTAGAVYEVKVRRADFLADLAKPEKREAYSALAEAVYYCCPAGLINADEVPAGYGLVEEGALGAFTIRRRARRQKGFCLHVNTALTLMVKRQMPI